MLNPIPTASERIATAANPGLREQPLQRISDISQHAREYAAGPAIVRFRTQKGPRAEGRIADSGFRSSDFGLRTSSSDYAYIPRILVTVATRLMATM